MRWIDLRLGRARGAKTEGGRGTIRFARARDGSLSRRVRGRKTRSLVDLAGRLTVEGKTNAVIAVPDRARGAKCHG